MNKGLKSILTWILVTAFCATVLPPMVQASLSQANIIVMVLSGLIGSGLSVVLVYANYKERKASMIVEEAAAKDSFWNLEDMKLQARSTIYKLQSAWDSRDASSIKDYSTPDCYSSYDAEIKGRSAKDDNPADLLDIHETRIICCQDHPDNNEDKFAAYIDGSLSFNDTEQEFTVVLHFVRSGNEWLLDKISHRAGIWDLLVARNVEEGS